MYNYGSAENVKIRFILGQWSAGLSQALVQWAASRQATPQKERSIERQLLGFAH